MVGGALSVNASMTQEDTAGAGFHWSPAPFIFSLRSRPIVNFIDLLPMRLNMLMLKNGDILKNI